MEEKLKSICGTSDKLTLLLGGGNVVRYHTEGPALAKQTNAEHTWRLLVILLHYWPDASPELIKAAIYHDAAERLTGDVPSPLKNQEHGLRLELDKLEGDFHRHFGLPLAASLHWDDQVKLNLADCVEVIYYLCEQPLTTASLGVWSRIVPILDKCLDCVDKDVRKLVMDDVAAVVAGRISI